jgi:hypothetical protein
MLFLEEQLCRPYALQISEHIDEADCLVQLFQTVGLDSFHATMGDSRFWSICLCSR